jgi:hypothetical protein
MPMTEPKGAHMVEPALLGSMEVEEVLYEAETPVLFTTKTASGQPLLAYTTEEAADATWLVFAACTPRTIADLKSGRLAVREALTSSWMWLAQRTPDGKISKVWAITPDHLPQEHLPAPGTPLLPEHEPVIATRAIGETIVPGATPASVVAYVADSTRKAIKTLLDFLLDRPGEGRPPEELRTLYDLPVQRFAFNSFEVAFGLPAVLLEHPELNRAAGLLRKGLSWAATETQKPLDATSDEERSAILRAALYLTPPPGGPITEVEVSGTWMSRGSARLTQVARRRVHEEIRRLQAERVIRRTGLIVEVDRDNLTFVLRDTGEGIRYRGVFEEELLDDMVDFFAQSRRAVIVGIERGGRLYVAAIGPTEEDVSPSR